MLNAKEKPDFESWGCTQTHDRATSELHIFLVTKRSIKKGQEILLDYGEVGIPII